MVAKGEVVGRMSSKQNKTINKQSDVYFTRRTFILISGKFHPDAQDSKSAVIGKGAGDAEFKTRKEDKHLLREPLAGA